MQGLKKMRDERTKDANYFVEDARPITQEEMMARISRNANKPKFYLSDENEDRSKYQDMSNVTDSEVLRRNSNMTQEDFNELVEDDMFKGKHNQIDSAEEEYIQQQKKLAILGDFSEESNFPNLRKR